MDDFRTLNFGVFQVSQISFLKNDIHHTVAPDFHVVAVTDDLADDEGK